MRGKTVDVHAVSSLDVDRRTRRCALASALLLVGACVDPDATSRAMPVSAVQPAVPRGIAETVEPVDAGIDAAEPEDAFREADAGRRARAPETPGDLFDPRNDEAVLARLRNEEIVEIARGRGGRSVAFRVTLASGTRAYFKPEQTFSGTHWFAEIAAFHLDRALHVHRTAPSTGRVLPHRLLAPALEGDPRAEEVIVDESGSVRGALIAWIEERLVPIDPPPGWEAALRLSEAPQVFPFVAAGELRRALASHDSDAASEPDAGASSDDAGSEARTDGWETEIRARELSIVIAFDFLTQNGDRWGGSFTNVRTRGVGGPIILLDNAAGFWRRRDGSRSGRPTVVDARLGFVERFDARFVERVRRLELESLRARLDTDPLAPILDEAQLDLLERRRRALLDHVDGVVEREGDARALAW
jgi:hypothetical protein